MIGLANSLSHISWIWDSAVETSGASIWISRYLPMRMFCMDLNPMVFSPDRIVCPWGSLTVGFNVTRMLARNNSTFPRLGNLSIQGHDWCGLYKRQVSLADQSLRNAGAIPKNERLFDLPVMPNKVSLSSNYAYPEVHERSFSVLLFGYRWKGCDL